MPEKCGPGFKPCKGGISTRLDELNKTTDRLNGTAACMRYIVEKMREVIDKRNEERDHYQYHNKCSPINCRLKQCPDPCGPYPCGVEVTCPKYLEEVGSKYRLLWSHLTQAMTERTWLKCENNELQRQIDLMIDQYVTPHDDTEICICCSERKPGYWRCGCCDCLSNEFDLCWQLEEPIRPDFGE